ncbi:MAG: hypothetical protein A2452_01565 [Candidatus Firestonebacteria bacterium RIFOXYC2_FULL_39_67]|nr:MAG: hypothetical protein A2536_05770 [Candidatus Firestonebacteria bacterium RIFOXYD2_FULL_39_29]OGF54200.1 MAG: hypothetical protein A2452_01565 [Candidatus Firestonebacteria bacterium RIFOXYC2_FULL_39_67]OGF57674.1 MAG: hypothetical protein A2497_03495 [Candidatus Firestonebacteria bacterium RifOxyC12_full_39_7]
MEKKYSKSFIAEMGLVFATILWGSSFFVIKDSLAGVSPNSLVTCRFLLAALVMAVVVKFRKKKLFSNLKAGIIVGFFLWSMSLSQSIGLGITSASNSGFITSMFIVFVAIFSVLFFKKNIAAATVIAVLIDVAGLWFLTGGLKEINTGDLLTLGTAMVCALHVLFVDRFRKQKADAYVLCFQQFLVAGVLSLAVSFVFNLPLAVTSTKAALGIVFLALFPGVIAYLIQLKAQKYTSSIKTSLIFTLEPVFAAGFAWTLGGEKFILTGALGGLLIVIGMLISEQPVEKIFSKIRCNKI